jgi:hypothetical protein
VPAATPLEQDPPNRGAQGRNRTTDTGIFSPLLYQLSYLGKWARSLPPRAPFVNRFQRLHRRKASPPSDDRSRALPCPCRARRPKGEHELPVHSPHLDVPAVLQLAEQELVSQRPLHFVLH